MEEAKRFDRGEGPEERRGCVGNADREKSGWLCARMRDKRGTNVEEEEKRKIEQNVARRGCACTCG